MSDSDDLARHVVMFDSEGYPVHPYGKRRRMSDDEYGAHLAAIMDRIKEHEQNGGKKRVLIHVHGGLNTLRSAWKRAGKLQGPVASGGYYPLFVLWRSGPVSSYLEHLLFVRQGRVHKVWGPLTSIFYLAADLGRGITSFPILWYHQTITALKTALPAGNKERRNAAALYGELKRRYMADLAGAGGTEIPVSLGGDNRGSLNKIGRFLWYFVALLAKLVSAPLIDATGDSAWANMLRQTQNLFRTPAEFNLGARRTVPGAVANALDSAPTGGLSEFLTRLSETVGPGGDGSSSDSGHEITIVGHSMGAIVVNEMLRSDHRLPIKNIVYMGAACSIGEFEHAVVPYLKSHKEAQFYNLCLHPIAEAREINFWDIVPRGSLLEWIDNFLSSPRTALDRRLGKWDNMLQATHIVPSKVRGRVHIKGFEVGARKPQKHGHFNDIEFWQPRGLGTDPITRHLFPRTPYPVPHTPYPSARSS